MSLTPEISKDIEIKLREDPEVGPYVKNINDYKSIVVDGVQVGTIRIDTMKDGSLKVGSVFISPEFQGHGYAIRAINYAIGDKPAYAFISDYNAASKRTFEKLGFTYEYTKEIDGESIEVWRR